MIRLVTTISIGLVFVALVWLSGHYMFADWYQQKYDRLLAPAVNYAALPALITISICGVVEFILRRFSAENSPQIVLGIFGIRIAAILISTIVVYFNCIERSYTIAYLIWIVMYYWAILFSHIISHIVDTILLNDNMSKTDIKSDNEQINSDTNELNEQY